MIKRIIATMTALIILPSLSCFSANASTIKTVSISIGNCRTDPDLRENDKKFAELKECYILVEGERTYAGILYGAENYNILGSDKVKCKVQSNAFKHYAVVTTDKGNSTSDDVKKGVAAYTKWVKLAGDNGDKGWANFAAGFIVE